MPRKSEGRQKIEIVRITKESSASVAFSKRRFGIFKKASELSTLCGAQIAIIVLSQTRNKVYSFGDPGVEAIVNRFLDGSPDPPRSRTSQYIEVFHNANVQQLYTQLTDMVDQLESEKKAGEQLHKIRKQNVENYWWDAPIESLGLEELELLKVAMLEMKDVAQKQVERLKTEAFGSAWARGANISNSGFEGLWF